MENKYKHNFLETGLTVYTCGGNAGKISELLKSSRKDYLVEKGH